MDEQEIRRIVRDEMNKNQMSGSPELPPHSHNGIDGLQIDTTNILNFVPIPSSNKLYYNTNEGLGSISVFSGGSGYTIAGSTNIIIGGGGTGAIIKVDSVSGGVVTKVSIVSKGEGYPTNSDVTTSGGDGTGLTINILTTSPSSFGFGNPKVIKIPSFELEGNQGALYPSVVMFDQSDAQIGFQGGYAPEGTIILNQEPISETYILWARIGGAWRGIELPDNKYDPLT